MAEKDNMKVNTSPVADVETGTAEDVEAIMKKYDRESNTRIWEGTPKQVIRFLLAAFSVLMLYMNLFANWDERVRRSLFVGFVIILSFLVYPMKKGSSKKNSVPIYDIILMVLGAGAYFYFVFNFKTIIGHATRISQTEVIVGVIGILILAETCRRVVGIPILCVATFFVGYAFYNGLGQGRAFAVVLKSIVYNLFYTTSGVIGTPIGVCSTYIALFILFGAFLEATGISEFFIQLANSLAGASTGGPAKVAVISSALCGMVSGSSVGNTVTTGSVTIPLMKKTGYQGEFAGAVEAASSTGGQIMPPIMGAAAFLMAEYTGVPYSRIAVLAILPAILYFAGIYIAVHLEAKKLGLQGLDKDSLPKFSYLVKKLYLLAPLVVLVFLVSNGTRTMQSSAAIAILVTIVVGLFNADNRITPGKIIDALEAGGKGTITVASACTMAGIVAGCITSTGLASKLLRAIVSASGGVMIVALLLTMVCCIVLGMGVPTTATYCIMAATCAPILMSPEIGVEMLAAHFFVFYFGIVADITPPVALAAYAGSAIAKAGPMKTAFNASRLAIAAFIVPYIIAMNPAMLFINTTIPEVVMITITSIIGIFGVAAGLSGFVFRNMKWWERILCIVGGLTLLVPGSLTDLIGLVLVGAVCVLGYQAAKKEKEMLAA